MSNVNPLIIIFDAWKTINRKLKREKLPRDTGYSAHNIRFDTDFGMIAKRPTRAKYNSTQLGNQRIASLYRYYKNSNDSAVLIALYGGILKRGYDDAGLFSNITTGMNTATNFDFITYKDLLYMFNGQDNNQVFTFINPTGKIETMGAPSLITLPSATVSLTAGNLGSGNYFYAIAQRLDGYQEGNASPSTARVDGQGSRIGLIIPSSPNSRCDGMYIYRTKSNSSILYYLTTITNNTAANTYLDNTLDTSLDTTRTAPIDYGIPASYQFACLHKERLFLARNSTYKSRIIYSDLRDGTSYPDIFPANNYLNISTDDGDEITAIQNDHLGQLVVFKKNSVRIIYTTADSDVTWSISGSLSNQGCIAPYSAVTTPIGIIYLSKFGEQVKRLCLWSGQGTTMIPQLEGIEPLLTAIPETAMDDIRGHYHNGYYYLSYRNQGLYNDSLLVINLVDWSVEIDKKNVSCFSSWNGGTDFGELYTGSSNYAGIDTKIVLWLRCDGADASTTFTDSSSAPKTVTAYGNAQIDTAQSRFGGASALFDGDGDYLTTPDSADWSFGTGDFTVDFQVRHNAALGATEETYVCQFVDNDNYWFIDLNATSLRINFRTSGVNQGVFYATHGMSAGTWYHLAFVRNGSTCLIFKDGVSLSVTQTTAFGNVGNIAGLLYIGTQGTNGAYLNGWIDELRISKGIARWTANFTAPTAQYTTSLSDETGFVYREDAEEFNTLIRKKSEIDQGTFSNTVTSGTEELPVLKLTNEATSSIAYRTWANMTSATDTWADMTALGETWLMSGEWLDTIREISAKTLSTLYWHELIATGSDIVLYLRVGDTLAECEAATFNGPYSESNGSDISAVTAGKYIQVLVKMALQDVADISNHYIYRPTIDSDNYAIKIAANYGSPAETTIEFDWQSGRIDLGDINEIYKRLRKRLRSVKVEYKRTDTSGSFDFEWYLDGNVSTPDGSFNTSFTDYINSRIYNFPLNTFCEDFWYRIYSNTDTKSFKIKRILFTISTEKYYVKK